MGNSQSRSRTRRRRKYLVAKHEEFWVDMQPFLLQRGYKLRPRYDPMWKPSWKRLGQFGVSFMDREDGVMNKERNLIDAIRISDGLKVVLKAVETDSEEIPILLYLNSERADTRNKTVPLLDVIMIPQTDDTAMIVMPILLQFSTLPFRYVGEVCEAFHEFLQGLVFLHEHNIAHMDACFYNLMMDPRNVIPNGFHFADWSSEDGTRKGNKIQWVERRSVAPVNYHFIDFGLSWKFSPYDDDMLAIGKVGQDRTVPEMSDESFYDPFKTDVYQLGNVLLSICKNYEGLTVFEPLGASMTCRIPTNGLLLLRLIAHFSI
ncbi:hypothetical protein BDZ97DRAFT_295935 [Flammula alnicola]|nr:hypothetical protein BDZ97DRAFT_295935 [Flammula alnicola]